ncbi:hypothetical protein [Streptomyces sp. TLI_185]|uniref:hypothetical protein n=1 Tax=Streptomyces sp. TLI_185 TaxID=2485151 RepID=UPI000F4EB4A8|nr:hypothetical protein [Streptomyces sp. TLI_185]RPF33174.1 hypothetical protein EDD92_3079 [Streptomyces sp. TLI_185]
MNDGRRLMPFPPERVLEDAAVERGLKPTRLHALLLPVWRVEIRATVTEGEDFHLIDRFLERGLAHGGLDTVAELAGFFALEEPLVAQAVRFLSNTGHIEERAGRLALTPLGLRSVQDDRRYVVTREDRRKLYFEALTCAPLARTHYDERTVTMLSGDALHQAVNGRQYPRFTPVYPTSGFDDRALDRLTRNTGGKERDRLNLPAALDDVQNLGGEELVFLPVQVVRGLRANGRPGLLVYGQAGAEPDQDLTAVCERAEHVFTAIETEEREAERGEAGRRAAEKWLEDNGLGTHSAQRRSDGTYSVELPPSAFGDDGVPLTRVGSYTVRGSSFFHVWCSSENLRKLALLERLDLRLGAVRRIDRAAAEALADRLARQLELDVPDLWQLRKGAENTGREALAAQLERLTRPEA